MEHVNLKFFAKPGPAINVGDSIPVFHRWIQKRDLPELLIDVADYTHVPEGPGVLLIAHEANYSLDVARARLGLLYNRKAAAAESGAQEKLQQAYGAALSACLRIEQEPEFAGKLSFQRDEFEVTLNDRLLHPNNDATWRQVEPELRRFCDGIFGEGRYTLARAGAPRERLRATVCGHT